MKFYATFGWNSILRDNYVEVPTTTDEPEDARMKMMEVYGQNWAFIYDEQDKPTCIDAYFLKEVPFGTPNARRP